MKKYLWIILFIFGLTFLVWSPVLKQTFLGEGYYYFDSGQNFFTSNFGLQRLQDYLSSYDNLPKLIFDILPFIFKDNLLLYQVFAIFTFATLVFVIYLVTRFLTKNLWVSLSASILFLASYSGVFELLAAGNYQRFAQRIPNFVFMFLSFYFLSKYFESRKRKYLISSILIFTLTVFMAHYSTFILPLFVIYPIISAFFDKSGKRALIKNLLISLAFLLINVLIIGSDFYTPKSDFVELLTRKNDPIKLVLLQLTSLSYPPTLLNQIAQITQPYTKTATILSLPIIATLLIGILIIKRREPKHLRLYLVCLLTLPLILILNVVIGRIDATSVIRGDRYYFIPFDFFREKGFGPYGGSRYYFLPTILISILWSLIFWSLFKTRKKVYQTLTLIILIFYLLYNVKLIWKEIAVTQPISENMKIFLSYVKSHSNNFSKDTTIVTPPDYIWASHIIRLFYGYPEMKFIPLKEGWEEKIEVKDRKNLVVLDFDNEKRVVIEK